MTWADWAIAIVLLLSILSGLFQGFFRTACSLVGLLGGLTLASRYYGSIAAAILPIVRIEAIADAIGFFTIALLVMGVAGLIGNMMGKALNWMGLGCLDMLGGAVMGFFQGMLFVTICIMITVAFFPTAQWLRDSRLPRQFFGALQMSMHVTPEELAERIRQGFRRMELETRQLTQPGRVM